MYFNAPFPYFGKYRHYLSKKFPNFRCSRFSSAYSQRPAPAGRVTRGRRSRDPRAKVV